MNNTLKSLVLLITLLAGCAAFGVPYTSDPEEKINYAKQLLEINRPVPADRLLTDAVEIYTRENNKQGLAQTYLVYAFFLTSKPLEDDLWRSAYEKRGFLDKTPYSKRYEAAIEYTEKAAHLYESDGDYDGALSAYMSMGHTYKQVVKNNSKACDAYKKALLAYKARKEKRDLYIQPFDQNRKLFKINEDVIKRWMNDLEGCK
ncbi:MAG: hypothetical protein CSYNP_03241 [Syntrophus sp. SKADARSKE-3]|nr:hypothetical protein [Syntrophus sp. SKADARSKE-3]